MATLSHVCIWSGKGWTHITADQAAELHPGGSVSSYSGLFMCELCGQYVSFHQGGYQSPHFRHRSAEKSKDCPERTFGSSYSFRYDAKIHDLPIKITGISSNSFYFELGLIRVPKSILSEDFFISVTASGNRNTVFKFSSERLYSEGTTFLSIGNIPYPKYTLSYPESKKELSKFWPYSINGIDVSGTLFDKKSGKRLPYDSDVVTGKDYYFLCNRSYIYFPSAISSKKISTMAVPTGILFLYEIHISELNEDAAKFMLNYHYRLTEVPVSVHPVWPPYVQGSHLIKYSSGNVTMILRGNIRTFSTFPNADLKSFYITEMLKAFEIDPSDRQQLISVGRLNVLKYTYLWREAICISKETPRFSITDMANAQAASGNVSNIPKDGRLKFWTEFDGKVIISKKDTTIDQYKIISNLVTEIEGITYGQTVKLFIGLDCVWEATYKKSETISLSDSEEKMFSYIIKNAGSEISAPHSLKNMLAVFCDYPTIYNWISKCIRSGSIPEKSFRRIQKIYIKRLQTK